MTTRFWCLFCLAVSALPVLAEAQLRPGGPMPPMPGRRGIPLYYEASALFTPDTSAVNVTVHFRVPRDFFIFVRNEGAPADSAFMATGEIVVELLDNQSSTVVRDLRFVRLYNPRQLSGQPGEREIVGRSSFTVRPGTYRLAFIIDDKQSGRNFADRSRLITAGALVPGAVNASKPILVPAEAASESSRAERVPVLNYGGDLVFGGHAAAAMLQVFLPDSLADLSVDWGLKNKAPLYGIDSTELTGTAFTSVPGRLFPFGTGDSTVYGIEPSERGWFVVFLPLPLERQFEGRCDLRVVLRSGATRREVSEGFRIVWPSKPGSLIDIDLAIDALQHIATDQQMDTMRSLSLSSRTSAFHAFWRAMDPDSATAYNEKFAEYYRRVDVAIERFRGPKDLDGYRTDQGRIFILYGAPSESRRVFSPTSAPQEIWTYNVLKQRFVFVDKFGTGVYILTDVQPL